MHKIRMVPHALMLLFALTTLSAQAQTPVANPDAAKEDWLVLFDGTDLKGWVPKIAKHDLGDNFGNTFRVEDGLLKVRYDKYKTFDGQFGHLFWKDPYSYYKLVVEYRFVGQQAPGNPGAWALRNSGAMLHSPDPRTMPRDQDFPISIEAPVTGRQQRRQASPHRQHVLPRNRDRLPGQAVPGSLPEFLLTNIRRRTMGATSRSRCTAPARSRTRSTGRKCSSTNCRNTAAARSNPTTPRPSRIGELIDGGYISLQSESHPIDFRKVELLNLAGCMDKSATNYKSYYVKSVPGDCKFADGAKPAMRRPGEYPFMADSLPQEGVPKGRLEGPFEFHSKIIAGTVRRYWIYVPAQYNPQEAGQRAGLPGRPARHQSAGSLRVPQAMENLIAKGRDAGDHRHLHHAGQSRAKPIPPISA